MLPRCEYRGRAVAGKCICTHPKVHGLTDLNLVTLRTCLTCPFVGDQTAVLAFRESTKPPAPADGPGNELKLLIAELDLMDNGRCGCAEMVLKMNNWGVDGCRVPKHRREIIAHLKHAQHFFGIGERLKASAKALRLGYTSLGSLVDEAIRRAAAKQNAMATGAAS